ncbi:MAG: protein kinase [Acidobacteriota bacterium]|nr:protein kinase [Acidobacteriota bacterium]
MPGNNWDQIQEIFFAAADLAVAERDAFLARACNGDAGLRAEIESLLRADEGGGSAIAAAIESEVSALLDDHAPLAGTRMGPYRLLKEIGRGGMGSVYLGERDDEQYRKLVAIKVVKRGMDSSEVLARFRHERQILASLEHPYIARLIDGGTTPDGRPFFVMEYVHGQPIDTYCREQGLNLESRLRLFLRVCEAVSYAHRALVVHRDLKPGNIFVGAEGIPKLLDFGVAKLLDPGNDPRLTSTSATMGPLTPEYASPEQIRGLTITTAADVYALGAILFELLTGRRAQRIATHSPVEIERVVCQTGTPRPSTVARAAGGMQRLDSDLDNIVLMAMRKEPERRYGSVNRFADDIVRYLAGRPILARQDSVVYRARKFARRNRLALAATGLIFLSLLGGMVLAQRQARQAEHARRFAETQRQSAEHERTRAETQRQLADRERERAEGQRQLAERETARAEAEAQVARAEQDRSQRRLAQMLELANSSLFDVNKAIEKLPGATDARRQIAVTTLRFLEDLSKDAGQDDRVRLMLAASYYKVANVLGYPLLPNLGDTKGALANYEKSAALLEPLLARDPDRADYLLQEVQTKVNWATLLARTNEKPRVVPMMRETLPAAQRLVRLSPQDPRCLFAESQVYSVMVTTLLTTDSGAALHFSQLQTQDMERALQLSPGSAEMQIDLGTAYSQQARVWNTRGGLQEAAELFRRAVTLMEGALARNPSDVLTRRSLMITYGNLGSVLGNPLYPNLGDIVGARKYNGKALAIARELAKADRNNQLAQYDLANSLLYHSSMDLPKEEWAESLANLQEADGILQKLCAADPRSIANWRTLAAVEEYESKRLEGLGKGDEAVAKARQSLADAEKALARTPSDLGLVSQALASEEELAEILARHGDQDEAVATARRAIARAEQTSAAESDLDRVTRSRAMAYQNLANIEVMFGNWSQARVAAQRAVDSWRQIIASRSPRADPVRLARAETLLQDCDSHLH